MGSFGWVVDGTFDGTRTLHGRFVDAALSPTSSPVEAPQPVNWPRVAPTCLTNKGSAVGALPVNGAAICALLVPCGLSMLGQ